MPENLTRTSSIATRAHTNFGADDDLSLLPRASESRPRSAWSPRSAALPAGVTLVEELERHERVWESSLLLRRVYRDWYRLIEDRLSGVPGASVELGAGIGRFARQVPGVCPTDVEPTPWSEEVVDAEALPYGDASVANLVLIDVFHHVARPARFLDEARRVLAGGGRVVILDPYCSPVSTVAYRTFHHETTDLSADALGDDAALALAPMDSNQARATLVFFRELARFERRWPELRVTERRLLSLLLYPRGGVPSAACGGARPRARGRAARGLPLPRRARAVESVGSGAGS